MARWRRLWRRNELGRQCDAELHLHLAPCLVASVLTGFAVACGRGDTVPPDGAEMGTPAAPVTTVVVSEAAVTSIPVSLPAPGVRLNSFIVLPDGGIMMAQSDPGRVFAGTLRGDALEWRQEVAQARNVTEMAWHESLGLLILDSLAQEFHVLSVDGRPIGTFAADRFERSACITSQGTVVASGARVTRAAGVASISPSLLQHLDGTGRRIGEFGRRFPYDNADLDFVLNVGPVACADDLIVIAFVHPPVVRAYRASGIEVWEQQLHLAVDPVAPVASRETGSIRYRYSVAALDVTVDEAGTVYVLKSGLQLVQARSGGSDRIDVFAEDGSYRGELLLPFRGTQIGVLGGNLYVMSHSPLEFRRIPLAEILPWQ